MNLEGLVTVKEHDHRDAERLARMMGRSFLEERWTRALFAGIERDGADESRLEELSVALMSRDIRECARHGCLVATPELDAAAICYFSDELPGSWSDYESRAFETFCAEDLTPDEADLVFAQLHDLAPVSVFDWEERTHPDSDFLHLVMLAVDPAARGTGAFRRLVGPLLAACDARGIDACLETYSDRLEDLYAHFGFETVEKLEGEGTDLVERCMVRPPAA